MKRKLRAFKIENTSITTGSAGVLEMLNTKLKQVPTAQDRRMKLNKQDSDEDLLAFFEWTSGGGVFFGMMMRIIPAEQGGVLSEDFFQKEFIQISDLTEGEENASQYKDHYYFALTDSYLVTDLSGTTTIERLQTYLNWLLEDVRKETLISLTPVMTLPPSVQAKDIKSVEFGGVETSSVIAPNESNAQFSLNADLEKITGAVWNCLFGDSTTWDKIKEDQLVSAKLVVKIKSKPKSMAKDEYQRVMGAIAKNVAGDSGFAIHTKNGTYSGDEIKLTKVVEVETTSKNRVSEVQLKQKMERFLQEIQ